MNKLTLGVWEIADHSLQWIGRSAVWLLLRRPAARDESALYAAAGGSLLGAVSGGVVGFALSDISGDIGAIGGTAVGCLLGACTGIAFGACVETVSSTIKQILSSLSSK